MPLPGQKLQVNWMLRCLYIILYFSHSGVFDQIRVSELEKLIGSTNKKKIYL